MHVCDFTHQLTYNTSITLQSIVAMCGSTHNYTKYYIINNNSSILHSISDTHKLQAIKPVHILYKNHCVKSKYTEENVLELLLFNRMLDFKHHVQTKTKSILPFGLSDLPEKYLNPFH